MKVVRKPVDVIAVFNRKELPMPVRVRLEVNGQEIVTKIDRIIKVEKIKSVGKGEIVYTCQSRLNGVDRIYELKFLLDTMGWSLYKI